MSDERFGDMNKLIRDAEAFAAEAHKDQKRKYTGELYINHPRAVANLVRQASFHTAEMLAAAYLHDTVEDTDVTLDEIRAKFGNEVSGLVYWLTDVSKPSDGSRAKRKAIDRNHLATAPAEAQTIKLADLIDNTSSIVAHDPSFARVYLREKAELIKVLTKGDHGLLLRAQEMLANGLKSLNIDEPTS